MSNGNGGTTLLGKLVTWFLMVLVAVAAIKVALWLFGVAFGIGAWLLFTVAPLVLVGWLVMKIWQYCRRPK